MRKQKIITCSTLKETKMYKRVTQSSKEGHAKTYIKEAKFKKYWKGKKGKWCWLYIGYNRNKSEGALWV